MKRVLVVATALVACLAIGSLAVTTAAAKKKKKPKSFATTVSLSVQSTPATTYSPGSAVYSGAVSAGGPAGCRSGRVVTITRNGAPVASATTQTNGSYSASVAAAASSGQYVATTPKRVIKKKTKKKNKKGKRVVKKFICLAGTSPPVTVG